jgi:hypothetical protein
MTFPPDPNAPQREHNDPLYNDYLNVRSNEPTPNRLADAVDQWTGEVWGTMSEFTLDEWVREGKRIA